MLDCQYSSCNFLRCSLMKFFGTPVDLYATFVVAIFAVRWIILNDNNLALDPLFHWGNVSYNIFNSL